MEKKVIEIEDTYPEIEMNMCMCEDDFCPTNRLKLSVILDKKNLDKLLYMDNLEHMQKLDEIVNTKYYVELPYLNLTTEFLDIEITPLTDATDLYSVDLYLGDINREKLISWLERSKDKFGTNKFLHMKIIICDQKPE